MELISRGKALVLSGFEFGDSRSVSSRRIGIASDRPHNAQLTRQHSQYPDGSGSVEKAIDYVLNGQGNELPKFDD